MSKVFFVHDNGGRPFRVNIFEDSSIKVEKQIHENEYKQVRHWKKVAKVFVGTEVSVLFEIKNNKLEISDGLKEIIHIAGDRIINFFLSAQDCIDAYYAELGNSDVVYSYFTTLSQQLFVFDSYTLVNIKNPPKEKIGAKDFWSWYYSNFSADISCRTLSKCSYSW